MATELTSALAPEYQLLLLENIGESINSYLKKLEEIQEKNSLGLIQQKELMKELNISPGTLEKWEKYGLKRYTPPVESTRKVFYKKSDVIKFLSMG